MKTKFLKLAVDPLKGVAGRLAPPELRLLIADLPPPLSTWKTPGETYRVYKLKSLRDARWADDRLYELLVSMRGSYYVYGERPPLDRFDAKSAIYAARVNYASAENGGAPVEEWLSIRLVPSSGSPLGAGELDIFAYDGKFVSEVVQERLCAPGESYVDVFPGCSRMCGIDPYFVNQGKLPSGRLSSRHAHSAVCYALMSGHILEDLAGTPARYLTGVIIDRFVASTLTVGIDGRSRAIAFTPAYKILGIGDSRLVRLDRRGRELYAYRYPAYHFDVHRLVEFLEKMVREGTITPLTLRHYLGEDFNVEEIAKEKGMATVTKLKDLWKLLTVAGDIAGSRLTGEALRDLLDEVPDGPELKITPLEDLRASVEAMLRAVQAVRI